MTEWGVVGVIVTLLGLLAAVTTPIVKLNTSIAKLTECIDGFRVQLQKLESENRESHKEFYKRIESTEKEVAKHEERIKALEEQKGE